tara:strand:+ start:2619 stop:3095 length:477 start_codon:yes stop_codon:yes gene_type:complete
MKKNSHFKYIGIDPGKSGGVTMIQGKKIKTYKCPQRTEDMSILFSLLIGDSSSYDVKLLMERVWARPNNAVRSAFAYGVNYGQWMGIIACHEVPLQTCLPNQWISYYKCDKNLEYQERKRWLKEKAKSLYPNLNITLTTADSILIADYAMKEHFKNEE